MPSHDLLPGDRAPMTTGIAVVKSWGPPVEVLIVASKGTGVVLIDDVSQEGTERPIWELVSVTKNAIELKCACGKPGCTSTATYARKVRGHHPQAR